MDDKEKLRKYSERISDKAEQFENPDLAKSLKDLGQDGIIAVALKFLNDLIEDNEKEWKKLDELSLGFDTPTKTRLSVHKIGLKNIKKILEIYERKAKIKKTLT